MRYHRRERACRAAIKETVRELGGVDILVNNAANYETVEFDQLTVKQWDAIFASNTRGPFLVSREALKHLRERKGRIINMGSLGGITSLGDSCSLLFFESCGAHADEGDGQGAGAGNRGELRGAGDDRSGREGGGGFMKKMARQTPMRRNGSG